MPTISEKNLKNLTIKEKDIERDILQSLSKRSDIKAFKINTVGVYDSIKKTYRKPNSPFILKGISDILGIIKIDSKNKDDAIGVLLAIEVKTPKRKKNVSDDQKSFIDMVNSMGGFAFVATSVQETEETIENFIRNRENYKNLL